MIKKDSYVKIKKIVLKKEDRASHLPKDTKEHDFMMKIKGMLVHDANLGDEVTILTDTKREVKGILIEQNPYYDHSFGKHVDEVHQMKEIILNETKEIDHD